MELVSVLVVDDESFAKIQFLMVCIRFGFSSEKLNLPSEQRNSTKRAASGAK